MSPLSQCSGHIVRTGNGHSAASENLARRFSDWRDSSRSVRLWALSCCSCHRPSAVLPRARASAASLARIIELRGHGRRLLDQRLKKHPCLRHVRIFRHL